MSGSQQTQVSEDRLTIPGFAAYLRTVSTETVRSWCYKGCPHLPNSRKPDAVPGRAPCHNGRVMKQLLLAKADAEAIRLKLLHEQIYEDERGTWLLLSLALERYPHTRRSTLYKFRNEPCPMLDGQILHTLQRPVSDPDGGRRNRWFFLEKDLKRWGIPQLGVQPHPDRISQHPHKDGWGRTWLPTVVACERFDVTESALIYHRNSGDLRAKEMRCPYRGRLCWFYLESGSSGLDSLFEARGGMDDDQPANVEAPPPAETALPQPAACPMPPTKPRWDEMTATLYWGDLVVRKFSRHPAKNQRDLIEAFHRENWNQTIPDPFNNHRKLTLTMADLNRTLAANTIRFGGDGTGEGAIWLPVE